MRPVTPDRREGKMRFTLIAAILAAAVAAHAADNPPPKVNAYFRDGLEFESEDGSFKSRLGGLMIVHYRDVSGLPESSRRAMDSLFLRQARLELSGTMRRNYEFKVQADFSTGSAAAILDGYLGWARFAECSVRAGQFKEPFSSEETDSIKVCDFADRSDLNRLTPQRDIGIMLYGRVCRGFAEYEAGIFNGQGRGVTDGNDAKEGAVRIALKPFKGLRAAVAGTLGLAGGGSIDGLDMSSKMLQVKFLDAATGNVNGRRDRLGLELAYSRGPGSLRGEWVRRTDRVDAEGFSSRAVESSAWYAAATWLLTGEEKSPGKRVVPLRSCDPAAGGWGALELACRAGELALDGTVFSLGIAEPSSNANRMLAVAAGLNWYPESNLRVTSNLVFERYNSQVAFSSSVKEDRASGVLVRIQADF